MREILTIVAACLVAALTAALAIPPFVDWDAQRARIEAQMSAQAGGVARIDGPVSLRLLPAPRMSLGALSLERDGLSLNARAVRLELSPTALLRGRFDFTDAALEAPRIVVTPTAFGIDATEGVRVGVQNLTVSDATVEVVGAAPVRLAHVDFTGSADTLAGPFRGAGVWRDGRRVDFSFSTGPVTDGKLRGKLALTGPTGRAEFDGDATLAAGALSFSGNGVVIGAAKDEPPWRASFALRAAPGEARAETLDLRLGDEDHALSANGEAQYANGALELKLASRNLDLDRFRQAYSGWIPLAAAASTTAPARVSLVADSVALGGDTIASTSVSLDMVPGAAPRLSFEADPPGRTHVRFSGAVEMRERGALDGEMRVSTRNPRAFGAWLAPAAPEAARLLVASPFGLVEASGVVKAHDGGFEATIADGRLDRSTLSGDLRWTPARKDVRAKLEARLVSPALDIDGLPDLSIFRALDGGGDLSVSLDAQAVRVARVGAASANAGRIKLRLTRDAAGAALDELAIADLGGASLKASGRFDGSAGALNLKLDARRLDDLAALARRVTPGEASEAFARRAAALSPAHLDLVLSVANGVPVEFKAFGDAGGTTIWSQFEPGASGADASFALRAQAADGASLMRQLGFPTLPLKGLGAGSFVVQGKGSPPSFPATAQFDIAGARGRFAGALRFAPDDIAASGQMHFDTADATPLVQMLGFGAADIARRIPVAGSAGLELARDRFALRNLSGKISDARMTGSLARVGDGELTGALSFDTLSAPLLASLVLGPPQPASEGALWPKIRFAPTLFDPPRASLDIVAARVELGDAVATDARAKLAFAPGVLGIRDGAVKLGDGTMSGDIVLRREGGAATLRAELVGDNLALALGPFVARASGRLSAAGAGASAGELVASLAGQGRSRLSGVVIARAASDAPQKVLAALDRDDATFSRDSVVKALGDAFDAGSQRIDPMQIELTLAAGRLSAAPAPVQAGAGPARLEGAFDLRIGHAEVRERIDVSTPNNWTGPKPTVDLAWAGPPAAMRRTIHADALLAAVAERAIARETARNLALEADIHERAFFNRRLKSDRRLDAERRADAEARRRAEEAGRADAARIERGRAERERTERIERQEQARSEHNAHAAPPAAQPVSPPRPSPPASSAFAPAPRGVAPDPSTAGRY